MGSSVYYTLYWHIKYFPAQYTILSILCFSYFVFFGILLTAWHIMIGFAVIKIICYITTTIKKLYDSTTLRNCLVL